MRVRHGLGTDSEVAANELAANLNARLADRNYWAITARSDAEREFGQRVARIFCHDMEPESYDFKSLKRFSRHIAAVPTAKSFANGSCT